MDSIGDKTPFEFELKMQEDGRYGMPLDDGNWNGKMHLCYNNCNLLFDE